LIVDARYLAVDPSAELREGAMLGETKRVCVVSFSIEIRKMLLMKMK
jgi:hypothetical protein